MDVEHGTLTPLVFGTNGGSGKECRQFLKTLTLKLATGDQENYSSVMTWLRIKISVEIVKSVNLCIRGSRVPFKKESANVIMEDFGLNAFRADIF